MCLAPCFLILFLVRGTASYTIYLVSAVLRKLQPAKVYDRVCRVPRRQETTNFCFYVLWKRSLSS